MRLKKKAVDIDCSRELTTVVRVRVHGDVGILLDCSSEELRLRNTGQQKRDGGVSQRTESPKLRTLPSLMFRLMCALATSMPPMIWRA